MTERIETCSKCGTVVTVRWENGPPTDPEWQFTCNPCIVRELKGPEPFTCSPNNGYADWMLSEAYRNYRDSKRDDRNSPEFQYNYGRYNGALNMYSLMTGIDRGHVSGLLLHWYGSNF